LLTGDARAFTHLRHLDGRAMRRQLAYILASHQVRFATGDDALDEVINNTRLADQFEILARELDVLEPKTAEDVYKTLTESRTLLAAV